ncbi:MAG: hypothetical protein K8R41_10705 [Bacteroidales bacterium]|nr:hypothetical protein [Bacteroidales bacterium]
MNIQTTKIELVKMILNIENNEFIQKVTDFIKVIEQADFWDNLSLSEQKEIKEGIKDLDKGDRIAYNEFLKKIS